MTHIYGCQTYERRFVGDEIALQTLALEIDKSHSEQTELGSVPEFVTELSVSLDSTDIQVDITTCTSAELQAAPAENLPPEVKLHRPNLRASVPH
jgi:hypothetical protein